MYEPASAPLTRSSPVAKRVAVVDRRRLIAEALAALIGTRPGLTLAGIADSEDSLGELALARPEVVIVGVGADVHDAIRIVSSLRSRLPGAEIVIVAERLAPELVSCVLEEGRGGLILTDASAGDVASCLEQVKGGRAVLPSGWRGALATSRNDPLGVLSDRQMEVLRLLADGLSYEEIGAALFISLNTVKFHVRSIFMRLGVRNRMAAARLLTQGAR